MGESEGQYEEQGEQGNFLSDTYAQLSEKIPYFPFSVLAAIAIIIAAVLFLSAPGDTLPGLNGEGQVVTISVIDAAGSPIGGVAITISGLDAPTTITTGTDGRATFTAPEGKQLEASASKSGFSEVKKTFTVPDTTIVRFTLRSNNLPGTGPKERTIMLTGPNGESSELLAGKQVTVTVSCSTGVPFPGNPFKTSTGTLKITPPEGCGTVRTIVSVPGFDAGFDGGDDQGPISLDPIDAPKGGVDFTVRGADTNANLDGIIVSLFDLQNIPTGLSTTTSYGSASLRGVVASKYNAVFDDTSGKYANQNKQIEVAGGATTKLDVALSRDIKLRVVAKVVESSNPVEGASVTLFFNGAIAAQKTSGIDGNVEFALGDDGNYSLQAGAEDYLPSARISFSTTSFTKGSTKEFPLVLSKCTPNTCGAVRVRVVDEDNLPVENALVVLARESGLIETALDKKITDVNGWIETFTNVPGGKFQAIAQKFPSSGKSLVFEANATSQTNVIVRMVIGTGTVSIKALDTDSKPVQGATAQIFTDDGNSLGQILLEADGTGSYKAKADRKVFVGVSAPGHASYFSVPRQIVPNAAIIVNAKLENEISGTAPAITYEGFYSDSGLKAESLQAGALYTVRLKLKVPTEGEFTGAVAMLRAGDGKDALDDVLQIVSASAPAAFVLKGATYNPPRGEDITDTTQGTAKWAQLTWDAPVAGTYEIETKVRVRQGTAQGTELPFYYNSYGIAGGNYSRDPQDPVLGSDEDSVQKSGFYADAHRVLLFEGIAELCAQEFCFSHRLLDVNQDLYTTQPYKTRILYPYELDFTLINNSSIDYSGAAFQVRNTGGANKISIDSYSIANANGITFNSQTPGGETAKFAAGDFSKNKRIAGKISLSTQTESGLLEFVLTTNRAEKVIGTVPIIALSAGEIALDVKPATVIAFAPISLSVTATALDKTETVPVSGAQVFVKKIAADKSEATFTGTTDADGNVTISVPAASPGTKISVWAQKVGYTSQTVRREVSATVISFAPAKVAASVSAHTKPETRSTLQIKSLLPQGIILKRVLESFDSKGLLNEERMDSFLGQFNAAPIGALEPTELTVLTATGSEADLLERPATVKGTIVLELSLGASSAASWIERVPYEATVNLADAPANSPCIAISDTTWNDSTVDNRSTLEFDIMNNCADAEGRGMDLSNLQSTIVWRGNAGTAGTVELSVTDSSTGETGREVLSAGTQSTLLGSLAHGRPYTALLTFVPKPNALGKTAQFTVSFGAAVSTNAGRQNVAATNPIEAQIVVANLDRCLKITPDPTAGIKLGAKDVESQFTVDTTACGEAQIDVRFCGESGNEKCSGGAQGSGILVTPSSFTGLNKETRTAKIGRMNIPGLYGLTVEARPAGGVYRRVVEIPVTIEPEGGAYFSLDRYQLDIIGIGAKDSLNVTNRMLQENVAVSANLCEWKSANPGPSTGQKAAVVAAGLAAGVATYIGLHAAIATIPVTIAAGTTLAAGTVMTGASIAAAQISGVANSAGVLTTSITTQATSTISVTSSASAASAASGGGGFFSSAVSSLYSAVPYIAVAVVVAIVLKKLLAKDPCKEFKTETLQDYVINLAGTSDSASARYVAPDATSVDLSSAKIRGEWNTKISDAVQVVNQSAPNGKQTVGVVFQNVSANQAEPVYAIAELHSKEHVNGDSSHQSATVQCGTPGSKGGDFGNFWINSPYCSSSKGSVADHDYVQKFHLRFNVSEPVVAMPKTTFDTYACESGLDIGRSGPGAAPKVKFNWSWKENAGGISYTQCDAANPNAVYCDATQFTIEVNKKLYRLHEFLQANAFDLGCPKPVDTVSGAEAAAGAQSTRTVLNGKIGVKQITLTAQPTGISASVIVQNKTSADADATVTIIGDGSNFEDSCTAQAQAVPAGAEKEVSCPFTITKSDAYAFAASATATGDAQTLDGEGVSAVKFFGNPDGQNNAVTCALKTTETIGGVPQIMRFVAGKDTIKWTAAVPNAAELQKLVSFDSYLIKDNYTKEFYKDFADYYTNTAFEDTDSQFTSLYTDSSNTKFGLNKLFSQNAVVARNKYVESPNLSGPGLYHVDLAAYFTKNNWQLLSQDGPGGYVAIIFSKISPPKQDSPFYYMPFDGLVGMKNNKVERQNYGTSFTNAGGAPLLSIDNANSPLKTYEAGNGTPAANVVVTKKSDLYSLNTAPATRGMVLEIKSSGTGSAQMLFAPSLATPVMLKQTASSAQAQQLGAFYNVFENASKIGTGSSLSYWSGAGNCLDFTGTPVSEAFYERPDRQASGSDGLSAWQNAYGEVWPAVTKKGDTYLRTIFYTTPQKDTKLSAAQGSTATTLLTPDESGTQVALNGVVGMQYNSSAAGNAGMLVSLQDVLSMVQSGGMCVTNTGTAARFFWNPQKIYTASGAQRNISEATNSLQAGSTCIG